MAWAVSGNTQTLRVRLPVEAEPQRARSDPQEAGDVDSGGVLRPPDVGDVVAAVRPHVVREDADLADRLRNQPSLVRGERLRKLALQRGEHGDRHRAPV